MTIYLNPTTMTKEEFLLKHGEEISRARLANFNLDDRTRNCIVCLVLNPGFSAAGVMNDAQDYERFSNSKDHRLKKFYVVSTEAINAEGGTGTTIR